MAPTPVQHAELLETVRSATSVVESSLAAQSVGARLTSDQLELLKAANDLLTRQFQKWSRPISMLKEVETLPLDTSVGVPRLKKVIEGLRSLESFTKGSFEGTFAGTMMPAESWVGKPVLLGGKKVGEVVGVVHDHISIQVDATKYNAVVAELGRGSRLHPVPDGDGLYFRDEDGFVKSEKLIGIDPAASDPKDATKVMLMNEAADYDQSAAAQDQHPERQRSRTAIIIDEATGVVDNLPLPILHQNRPEYSRRLPPVKPPIAKLPDELQGKPKYPE